MRITPEVIEIGGFDAVQLLSPEAYPNPEYDTEYIRLGEIIDALSEVSGDDMPIVPTPVQKRELSLLNYVRDWREALFVR